MKSESIRKMLEGRTPKMMGSDHYSKYAILLPLIQTKEGIDVLFEVRSLELRRQPGEICFPGGRIEFDDKNEKTAAIRETLEELQLKKENIATVYPLDYLISPFGTIIYPFAGFVKEDFSNIQPNPSEVAEIFTVPLAYFLETEPKIYYVNFKAVPEENFPFDQIVGGQNYQWQLRHMEEYFYQYKNKVIWGLTAKILTDFINIIR